MGPIPNPGFFARAGSGRGPKVPPWLSGIGGAALQFRVVGLVAMHGLLFALIYTSAYLVRFDGAVPARYVQQALATLPLVVGLKLAAFLSTGCHRGWWRYATFADLIALVETATLSSILLVVAGTLYRDSLPTPRSVVLMDWAGTLLVLCGLRVTTRLLRERYYPMITTRRCARVLVVGATEASIAVVRQLQGQPHLNMKAVGFLDDARALHGRVLAGIRVLGTPADLRRLAARHRVEAVLIPVPAVPPRVVRDLVAACSELNLKVQVVPGFDGIITGSLTVRPRDVEIEDLLCRDPIQLDSASIGRFLHDRVVLVTGAAGSIGSEICRQVLSFRPRRLILLDHSENGLFFLERALQPLAPETVLVSRVASITDRCRLRATFAQLAPAVVFHAAAHKHVPMMEENPGEAVKNNVFGTRTLVDEALRAGVEAFVMISTDKAVNPTSVMGACKRLAEMYIQANSGRSETRLVTVRFGNVLGSNGSVVPIFREQIRTGGPVTVTHPEMTRYFMTIPEAAQLVLQAGAQGRGGEIFVLEMGRPVKIVELARQIIRLSGMVEGRDIEIAFTGLRPGEKLYEELYDSGEEHIPTVHPKILAVKHRACCPEWLQEGLDRLAGVVDRAPDEVIAALKELIPEYRTGRAPGLVEQVTAR